MFNFTQTHPDFVHAFTNIFTQEFLCLRMEVDQINRIPIEEIIIMCLNLLTRNNDTKFKVHAHRGFY
jgi:hypothetical protein